MSNTFSKNHSGKSYNMYCTKNQKLIHKLACAFLVLWTCSAYAAEHRPNIIVLLADDMGVGDISALNANSKIHTPHIDSLIASGMTFSDAHSAAAVCTPTRYGLLTGRYPWRSELKKGIVNGYSKPLIKNHLDTIPKLLKRGGYKTTAIGKWHLGFKWKFKAGVDAEKQYQTFPKGNEIEPLIDFTQPISDGPIDCGFDQSYILPGMPPYVFIKDNKVENVPDEMKETSGPKQQMMRAGVKYSGVQLDQLIKIYTKKANEFIDQEAQKAPFFIYLAYHAPHTPVVPSKDFIGTSKAGLYGDFIQELDWSVGEIIKNLKKNGLLDNTLIIFTADNGFAKAAFSPENVKKYDHHPSLNYKGQKASLSEGGHRVPFIAHWPALIKTKTENKNLLCLNDIYATCAEVSGVAVPKNQGVDSFSFLNSLKGSTTSSRNNLVMSTYSGKLAVRKGPYKLSLDPQEKHRRLYNLEQDVSEKKNLYRNPEYQHVITDLMNEITQLITQGRSTKGEKLMNEGPQIWDELYWLK